jgi:hypothetical protein
MEESTAHFPWHKLHPNLLPVSQAVSGPVPPPWHMQSGMERNYVLPELVLQLVHVRPPTPEPPPHCTGTKRPNRGRDCPARLLHGVLFVHTCTYELLDIPDKSLTPAHEARQHTAGPLTLRIRTTEPEHPHTPRLLLCPHIPDVAAMAMQDGMSAMTTSRRAKPIQNRILTKSKVGLDIGKEDRIR